MSESYYMLQVKKHGVAARVELNDVPLLILDDGEHANTTGIHNLWILPGENRLRIAIDWPEDVSFAAGAAKFKLELLVLDESLTLGAAESLLNWEWPGEQAAVEETDGFPIEVELPFDVAAAPPSAFWPSARPIEPTEADHDRIMALVCEVSGALASRDGQRLMQLLDYRTKEEAQALHRSVGEMQHEHRELFDALAGDEEFSPVALDPERLNLQLVAGDRVVWVTDDDNGAPIRADLSEGQYVGIPVYVAPVGGRWTVVR